MSNALKNYDLEKKDRMIVDLLESLDEKLARIIELLESQGRVRPG